MLAFIVTDTESRISQYRIFLHSLALRQTPPGMHDCGKCEKTFLPFPPTMLYTLQHDSGDRHLIFEAERSDLVVVPKSGSQSRCVRMSHPNT